MTRKPVPADTETAAATATVPPLPEGGGAWELVGGVWVKDAGSTREDPIEPPVEGMTK